MTNDVLLDPRLLASARMDHSPNQSQMQFATTELEGSRSWSLGRRIANTSENGFAPLLYFLRRNSGSNYLSTLGGVFCREPEQHLFPGVKNIGSGVVAPAALIIAPITPDIFDTLGWCSFTKGRCSIHRQTLVYWCHPTVLSCHISNCFDTTPSGCFGYKIVVITTFQQAVCIPILFSVVI